MKLPKGQHLKGKGQKPFDGWGRPNSNPKVKKKINRAKPDGFKRN